MLVAELAIADWATTYNRLSEIANSKDGSVSGNVTSTIPLAQKAINESIAEFGPNHLNTSISYCALAQAYNHLGNYRAAEPLYTKAMQIFGSKNQNELTQSRENMIAIVNCMFGVGISYMQTGQIDRTITWFKNWRNNIQNNAAGGTFIEARILAYLGEAYSIKGDLETSLEYRITATKLYKNNHDEVSSEAILTKVDLADTYARIGDYRQSLLILDDVATTVESLKATNGTEYPLINAKFGEKLLAIGEYSKGLEKLRLAAPLIRDAYGEKSLYYLEALKATTLAQYSLTKNAREAYDDFFFLEQKYIASQGDKHPSVAGIVLLQGIAALGMEDPKLALSRIEKAESMLSAIGADSLQFTSLSVGLKASAKSMAGDSPAGLQFANESLALNQANFGDANPAKAMNYALAAYAFHNSGNDDVAIILLKNSINIYQKQRGDLSKLSFESQVAYTKKVSFFYQRLTDLLLEKDRFDEAQIVLDMLKENEFDQFTNRSSNPSTTSSMIELTEQENLALSKYQNLITELIRLNAERTKLSLSQQGKTSPELSHISLQIKRVNESIANLVVANLRQNFRLQERQRAFDQKDLADQAIKEKALLVQQLGKKAALAQYYVTEDKVGILLTTAQGRSARSYRIPIKELNATISNFLTDLKSPKSDPKSRGNDLYKILIAPIEKELQVSEVRTLMISLDGNLRYIPFSALYDGNSYLLNRFDFPVYTTIAHNKMLKSPDTRLKVAGFGVTKQWGDLRALPGVKAELQAIHSSNGGVLPGEIYLDESFTKDRLADLARKPFPVVHIASHFIFSPGTESNSFLLLGDGKRLTLTDIRSQNLRFDGTDLLTLSACETGKGGGFTPDGKEIEGFGVIAQQQGAKAVLATLWKVEDKSTSILMADMYSQKLKGKNKIEALSQAQIDLKLKSEYSHPYFWAPFILMGNWL